MTRSSIPTAAELRRSARRLDRLRRNVDRVLAAMQNGDTLHFVHQRGRATWKLSSGSLVTPEAASVVIRNAFVAPAGDALFSDTPGQAWRFAND